MKFSISMGRHVGKVHERRNLECEDMIKSYQDDNISIISVSDGCSTSLHSKEAAQMNNEIVIELFKEEAVWGWGRDKIRYELANRIKERFEKMGYEKKELLATLTAVAIRADGEYIGVSIGDGFILGINQQFESTILRFPYNTGGESKRTLFTFDTEGCYRETAVTLHNLQKALPPQRGRMCGFVIGTDGAGDLLLEWAKVGTKLIEELAMRTVCEDLNCARVLAETIAKSNYCIDDVSVGCIMLQDEQLAQDAVNALAKLSKETDEPEPEPEEPPKKIPTFEGISQYYYPVLYSLVNGGKTLEQLEAEEICPEGKSLEILLPLISKGIIRYENQLFILNETETM